MSVYYGLAALVLLLYLVSLIARHAGVPRNSVDQINNFLIALAVFSVFALRSTSVGVDVDNYVGRFDQGMALATRKMELEIGYAAVNDGVRLFTTDPHVFLAVVAALTIAPIAWVISKSSLDIYLSWILFMTLGPFALMFSGLRQGIALAIVFATLPFLTRRKVFAPLLLTALAATFHTSALVFLPAVFLYRVRLNPRTTVVTVGALAAVAFFGEQIVAFAIERFYETYDVVFTGAYRRALAFAALWLALATLYRSVRIRLPRHAGLFPLVLAGVVLLTLAAFGTNVSRAATYFLQFLAILAPSALSTLNDRRVGALISTALGAMALAYFFMTLGQAAYGVVPYEFMWER